MTGHSILYLGRGDFASEYLAELETLPCCTMLARSPELKVPVEDRELLYIVLLEASPVIAQSGNSLSALINTLRDYPVVMGVVLLSSLLLLIGNIISDILVAFIDPRIRFQ